MFLLRTIFWLVVLVLLLPTNAQQQSQVYGTAQAAVKDVSGFCERNPTVCATGKDAFDVFVHKARFGAEMLMSFVKGKTGFGGGDAETAADPSAAGTAADPTATETPGDFDSAAPFGHNIHIFNGCRIRPACSPAARPNPQKKSARTTPRMAPPVSCATTSRCNG